MTITAAEAAKMTVNSKLNKQNVLVYELEELAKAIHLNISSVASAGNVSSVTYTWSAHSYKNDKKSDVFQNITNVLYHWDGGEGRGDTITEFGVIFKEYFEGLGYKVSLFTESVSLSWGDDVTKITDNIQRVFCSKCRGYAWQDTTMPYKCTACENESYELSNNPQCKFV